jgi:PII-like signaling protein
MKSPVMKPHRVLEEAEEAEMLRIFLGESDVSHGRSSYEAVVQEARKAGLAGATVFRGMIGYGANSVIHKPHLLRLSGDLPVLVEIVDEAEKIRAFLAGLDGVLEGGGLITLERVRIVRYSERAGVP